MLRSRTYLQTGTRIQLEGGELYEIADTPIGEGGGSLIYPAYRLTGAADSLLRDGILYALKECYPLSPEYRFIRDSRGQIVPEQPDEAASRYLEQVQQMQLREQQVTQTIYRTGFRLLPIREAARRVLLTAPEGEPTPAENTVTVMESLAEKGQSLNAYLRQYRKMTCVQTFYTIQQLLYALREIHQAGYLHLDLQGGNIFLRGTLEDGSTDATIIDFGSARPLADGKTAAISDRMIFTTAGFSAPEILLRNDGTLRLGPEADLYSAGCLMLYLLTGSRYDTNELQRNTTGNYLTRFKLRKIDCPPHLVPRMQGIIAHALKNDPEERYHSSDEMLADVEDFLRALQPYRHSISDVDYDAFICYRHGPVDSAAALFLQRRLEHFRTTKEISASRHPFRRVFVDEGELSSCADFGAQIRAALKNTDWLIVICSPDTPDSQWVRLEIDTFLEFHDRSHILAVLTSGEPTESFPPQLLGDGDGAGEVLAADARGKSEKEVFHKLKGDALYRIAAPMLGTTFDALKQRRRVYVLRRAAAAALAGLALVSAFSIYAVRQAQIIARQAEELNEEYQNVLLNQSRYLVKEAEGRMDANDPLGAVEKLLAALPSAEQDRPILPEAVYELSQALGVYTTPLDVEDSFTAVGVVSLPDYSESDFFLDPTGSYLFTADSDSIYVWNAETCQLLRTDPVSMDDSYAYLHCFSEDLLMSSQPHLLYANGEYFCCRNYQSGELLWSAKLAGNPSCATLSEDEATAIVLEDSAVELIDARNGSIFQTIPFRLEYGQHPNNQLAVSEDGSKIAFSTYKSSKEDVNQVVSTVYLADTETRTVEALTDELFAVRQMLFTEDSLVILSEKGYTWVNGRSAINFTHTSTITSYQTSDWNLQWKSEFRHAASSGYSDLAATIYQDDAGIYDVLSVVNASYVWIIDQTTGALLRQYDLGDSSVSAEYYDGGLRIFTSDGNCYFADFQSEEPLNTLSVSYFTDSISGVQRFKKGDKLYYYVLQNSGSSFSTPARIIKYEYEKSDDSFAVSSTFEYDNFSQFRYLRDGLSYQLESWSDVLWLFDESDTSVQEIQLPGEEDEEYWSYEFLGLSKDNRILYLVRYASGRPTVVAVDISTGVCEPFELPAPVDGAWQFEDLTFLDGSVIYLGTTGTPKRYSHTFEYTSHNTLVVASWIPGSETPKKICECKLEEAEDTIYEYSGSVFDDNFEFIDTHQCMTPIENYIFNSISATEDQSVVFLVEHRDHGSADTSFSAISVDLNSGALTKSVTYPIEGDYAYSLKVFPSQSGQHLAVVDQHALSQPIAILDNIGKQLCTISNWDSETYGDPDLIFFAPDERSFCVFSDSGDDLLQFDTQTGALLKELDLSAYGSVSSNHSAVDLDDSTVLLLTGSTAFQLDFSGDSLSVLSAIKDCIGYDEDSDRFIIGQSDILNDTYTIGSFPRYSVGDLVQMGQELIGNTMEN